MVGLGCLSAVYNFVRVASLQFGEFGEIAIPREQYIFGLGNAYRCDAGIMCYTADAMRAIDETSQDC